MYFGSYFFFQVASSQIHVTLERKDVWPSSVSANMPVTAVGDDPGSLHWKRVFFFACQCNKGISHVNFCFLAGREKAPLMEMSVILPLLRNVHFSLLTTKCFLSLLARWQQWLASFSSLVSALLFNTFALTNKYMTYVETLVQTSWIF